MEERSDGLEGRVIVLQDELLHARDEIRALKRDNHDMWSLLIDFWDEVQPEVRVGGTRFGDIHDRLVDIGVVDPREEEE